jgi:hypothetical protein
MTSIRLEYGCNYIWKNAGEYRSGPGTIYARMADIQYTRTKTCIHRLLQEAYYLPQRKPTYHTKNRVLIAQAHTDIDLVIRSACVWINTDEST